MYMCKKLWFFSVHVKVRIFFVNVNMLLAFDIFKNIFLVQFQMNGSKNNLSLCFTIGRVVIMFELLLLTSTHWAVLFPYFTFVKDIFQKCIIQFCFFNEHFIRTWIMILIYLLLSKVITYYVCRKKSSILVGYRTWLR